MLGEKLTMMIKLTYLKFLFTASLFLVFQTNCFAQKERKIYYFISLQGDKALNDYQIESNKGGGGLGLQLNFKTKTFFEPTVEFNASSIGKGDEIFFLNGGSETYQTKTIISSTYLGSIFEITKQFNASATFGTSFYNEKAHFGVRSSLIYYPSKSQSWVTKLSFTNVFQNNTFTTQDFGYLSFSVGINLSK